MYRTTKTVYIILKSIVCFVFVNRPFFLHCTKYNITIIYTVHIVHCVLATDLAELSSVPRDVGGGPSRDFFGIDVSFFFFYPLLFALGGMCVCIIIFFYFFYCMWN